MGARTFLILVLCLLFEPLGIAYSAERYRLSIEPGSIQSVLEQFSRQTRLQVITNLDVAAAETAEVGPFVSQATADEALTELLKDTDLRHEWQDEFTIVVKLKGCAPGSILNPHNVPDGDIEYDFSIRPSSRIQAIRELSQQADGLLLGYISNDEEEEKEIVGPISGRQKTDAALGKLLIGSQLCARWVDRRTVAIEPTRVRLPPSRHVTVTESRLPSLEEFASGQVVAFGRAEIAASGSSNIPDFLRYATQFPYTRPKGTRLTGAQFAELRGLEPQYTLVLINGVRADVSASDLMVSAFDLGNIPISAVERIEISASSPSLVHGMDAIAGIVNIILRDDVSSPLAEVRYGSANGGVREKIGTVAAGTSSEGAKTALFFDHYENSELLGAERERWRNQDYTRFGGPDRRSRYSAPPNIYTLDGQNLPGLDAPEAAVSLMPSGEIVFLPGETNLTSSLAMQAIVPEMRRTSITGLADLDLGGARLSADVLFVHRHAHFQHDAEIVPGFTMDAGHPQNPFHIPIAVDAALTGLPPRATDSRLELLRGAVKLSGPIGASGWHHYSFLRLAKEHASAAQINFIDASAVMNGLAASGSDAVNVLGDRPGEGSQGSLISPRQSRSSAANSSQVTTQVEGELPLLRLDSTFGLEYRTEGARFNGLESHAQRHEASIFGRLKLPIGERLSVTYGTRSDDFSDLKRIRGEQWAVTWRPTSLVEFRAAYNETFRAPSIVDLHLPRNTAPVPIFDPLRGEVSTVNFIFGGNENLAPTTGASSNIGVKFETDNNVTASMEWWRIRMRDHISPVSPIALLANEGEAIAGRIFRDSPSALDQDASRPGRLLALDVSRANFGNVDTRGIDISIQKPFETALGTLSSRFDLTYTDAFRYSDLPISNAPMRDRAGLASVLGTIPSWRGTCSLGYRGYGWETNVFTRYHSSYRDYSMATNTILDRNIPANALLDFTISKHIGAHIGVTIGVIDVLNRAPPYAEVGDPAGFDPTQGDLTGRTAFIRISGSM